MANILLIEPFYTGSYKQWCEGFKKHSSHNVEILSMAGRHWKWRMHGGAITLAREFNELKKDFDVVFATDMLDVTTFKSLINKKDLPIYIYFHENQLTYPWKTEDRDVENKRDHNYGFINFSSALASDKVFFNSKFHYDIFFKDMEVFLKNLPDYNELESLEKIKDKSKVLYLGMDFDFIDLLKGSGNEKNKKPLLLWNHRWEHDKNPEDFFKILYQLQDEDIDFELAIVGENFKKSPEIFNEAKSILKNKIVQFGFCDSRKDYGYWLRKADLLPVMSTHDFFGASVVEAIYAGAFPLLPKRLSYPEHIDKKLHKDVFYGSNENLKEMLKEKIKNIDNVRNISLKKDVEKYSWKKIIKDYDDCF